MLVDEVAASEENSTEQATSEPASSSGAPEASTSKHAVGVSRIQSNDATVSLTGSASKSIMHEHCHICGFDRPTILTALPSRRKGPVSLCRIICVKVTVIFWFERPARKSQKYGRSCAWVTVVFAVQESRDMAQQVRATRVRQDVRRLLVSRQAERAVHLCAARFRCDFRENMRNR